MQYHDDIHTHHEYSPVATNPSITQNVGLASKLVAASTLCSNSTARKGGSSAVRVLVTLVNVYKLSLLNLLCRIYHNNINLTIG